MITGPDSCSNQQMYVKLVVFNTFAQIKFDCHGSPHRPFSKP